MKTLDLINIAFLPLERRNDFPKRTAVSSAIPEDTGPQQPMSRIPPLVERPASSSPCSPTAGTAGVGDFSERALAEGYLGKPIVTVNVCPPIPCREHDWCAYPAGEEEDGAYGWGPTEAAAIADLIQLLRDDERIPETL
jgi:hypothetical protein